MYILSPGVPGVCVRKASNIHVTENYSKNWTIILEEKSRTWIEGTVSAIFIDSHAKMTMPDFES